MIDNLEGNITEQPAGSRVWDLTGARPGESAASQGQADKRRRRGSSWRPSKEALDSIRFLYDDPVTTSPPTQPELGDQIVLMVVASVSLFTALALGIAVGLAVAL